MSIRDIGHFRWTQGSAKSEGRNPKSERSLKPEGRTAESETRISRILTNSYKQFVSIREIRVSHVVRISDFKLLSDFGIRISGFIKHALTFVAALLLTAPTAHADWQLTWSDEFNGTAINTNNWTFDIGTGPPFPGWGNNELEYYTSFPENAYVSNGFLHIVGIKTNYSGSSYTSAKMKTLGLFSQTDGRFEFSARLPAGQGYWPALWMMPRDSVYGGWAASGEIDVMENKGGNPTNVLGTIHFGGIYPHQTQSFSPSFTFPA